MYCSLHLLDFMYLDEQTQKVERVDTTQQVYPENYTFDYAGENNSCDDV